jgi:hypothetical protein
MKRLIICATTGMLAASLSACGGLPGTGGQNFDLNKFLTDPACAHDDEIQGVTGAAGIPASLQFKAARHCPGAAPVAVGALSTSGAGVAPVVPGLPPTAPPILTHH